MAWVQNLLPCLTFLVLQTFICNSLEQRRATYGETCDKNTRCNSRSLLTCADGVCKCLKETEMTYDKSREKCVLLTGERCTYTAIETKDEEKRWTETLDCVENAVCKQDGYCGCTSNYFESSKGVCVPKLGYGEVCAKDGDCSSEANLLCTNGKCSCNDTESVYDHRSSQCVAKVGASCRKYGKCAENAFCYRIRYGYEYSTKYDVCQCNDGTVNGTDGLCYASYNSKCDPVVSPCLSELICTNGRCTCPFPDFQSYNCTTNKCVSSIHGPCSEKIGEKTITFPCKENMECQNGEGNAIPECLCVTGFIESKNGECLRSHGSSCNDLWECDEINGLICKNGTCTCKDFQEYDGTKNVCRGKVGAKCRNGKDSCIGGADCQPARDKDMMGTCRCIPPLKGDLDRKCTNNEDESVVTTDNPESESFTGRVR